MINVMEEYISFTKKKFHEYLKYILDKKYDKNICEEYIDNYLMIRYTNYLDEETIKWSLLKKIERGMNTTAKKLIENGCNKEQVELIKEFCDCFYNLDQLYLLEAQKKTIIKISELREKKLGIADKDFVNKLTKIVRDDIKKRKDFLDDFESDIFRINKQLLVSKSNKYMIKLKDNIKFPEIYSKDAIKKAAEKDSISEDLFCITLMQLSAIVVTDTIACEFDNTYYVYLPDSLFDKKVKLNRVFGIIDNVFMQDRIRSIVTYECFKRYKSYVMELMRKGFVFAIYLDESFDYSSENIEYLELFESILLNSKKYYYKDMKNDGKIKSRIIDVDEVK